MARRRQRQRAVPRALPVIEFDIEGFARSIDPTRIYTDAERDAIVTRFIEDSVGKVIPGFQMPPREG